MEFGKIELKNFRNHKYKEIEFPKTLVIEGKNGSGKTNILEAMYLLSAGKSMRGARAMEMVTFGESVTRIKGEIQNLNGERETLEIVFSDGSVGGAKKRLLVNGIARRWIDFAGRIKSVFFGPWEMELLTGSPSARRDYLDLILIQVDREYRRSLLSYEKGLRRRNKVLEAIRDQGYDRKILLFWDNLLIKNGNYLTDKKMELVEYLNSTKREGMLQYKIDYDRSEISVSRLLQYKDQEVAAAATLVGPHRDDFGIGIRNEGNRDIAKYGSRGQQRMAMLWMKMGEIDFIEVKSGVRPVLLLDDIFSELDLEHRGLVANLVSSQQTVMTTADLELVPLKEGWRVDGLA